MNKQTSRIRRDGMGALAIGALLLTLVVPQGTRIESGIGLVVNEAAAAEWAFVKIERDRGLPRRGQSRASVKNQFGEPLSRKGAVGNPPISSWIYSDFTVYFEHNLVITTVASQDNLPNRLEDIQ